MWSHLCTRVTSCCRTHLTVTFDHAGETFEAEVPPAQQVRAALVRALTQFDVDPAATDRYRLTHRGNRVKIDQSFADAGIPDEARLRIRPRVQRNGAR